MITSPERFSPSEIALTAMAKAIEFELFSLFRARACAHGLPPLMSDAL